MSKLNCMKRMAGIMLRAFSIFMYLHRRKKGMHPNYIQILLNKIGLYWQGITHDLSKYSWAEFAVGAKYYQGVRSPNAAERDEKGYSEAWMHHKGRNRHHYEYWTDMNIATKNYESLPMPRKYLVEMVMDRRAACITYQGKNYKHNKNVYWCFYIVFLFQCAGEGF
mgnify:CR=1 FL=1